jgi:glucokinase
VSGRQAIGVDVGGTKTAALRVSAGGEILDGTVVPTPADDEAAILTAAEAAIADVMDGDVVAIGVGAAGLVDVRAGLLLSSPNLAWRNVPLAERLGTRFGLPVTVDNDATAAAWAEARFGASRKHPDSLFVGVGTGIGGGIVMGGRLIQGAHGFAGEIGHIIVQPDGPSCGCGNRGCWEQVAGGPAISRAGRSAATEDPESGIARLAGGDPARVTGELVVRAATEGDPIAVRILGEVGRRLGEGIAGLVNVLDPQVVVLGGGVGEIGALVLEPLREAYLATVEGRSDRPDVPILPAVLGNDAGAIGAALLAIEAASS